MHHEHHEHDANEHRIASLDDLDDFEVHDDDPDIRGWEVIAEDGERIGEVKDLLVDTVAMKVRYLGIDVDEDRLGRLLVPVGCASLDDDEDRVRVQGIRSSDLGDVPLYGTGGPSREDESAIRRRFDPAFRPKDDDGDWYEHPHFDDRSLHRSRSER